MDENGREWGQVTNKEQAKYWLGMNSSIKDFVGGQMEAVVHETSTHNFCLLWERLKQFSLVKSLKNEVQTDIRIPD